MIYIFNDIEELKTLIRPLGMLQNFPSGVNGLYVSNLLLNNYSPLFRGDFERCIDNCVVEVKEIPTEFYTFYSDNETRIQVTGMAVASSIFLAKILDGVIVTNDLNEKNVASNFGISSINLSELVESISSDKKVIDFYKLLNTERMVIDSS